MRSLHRTIAVFVVLFGFYMGVTGSLIQLTDLTAILSHAPHSNPTMEAIDEGVFGPGNFVVISPPDFAAPALPNGYDYLSALTAVAKAAPLSANPPPIDYIELRMEGGVPVARVKVGNSEIWLDPENGTAVTPPSVLPNPPRIRNALHNFWKNWHRSFVFGDNILSIYFVLALGLFAMVCTGLLHFISLMRTRASLGRTALFWFSGGWWRSIHRGVAIVSAAFLIVVTLTGTWLAFDSFYHGQVMSAQMRHSGPGVPRLAENSPQGGWSPLPLGDVQAMARVTLAAYKAANPAGSVKVLRLRVFGGMPQGIIIGGSGETDQFVFNAATGARASETEPGYPSSSFPLGWQFHETVKMIHRGDYFGLTGRWMSLFAAFALVYLSMSGAKMYLDLWRQRRKVGRNGLFWK